MILERHSQTRSERLAATTLGAGALLVLIAGGMLWFAFDGSESTRLPKVQVEEREPITFSLRMKEGRPLFPFPNVERELLLSSSPPRPNSACSEFSIFIGLVKNGLAKRAALPSRVDLKYDEKGELAFSDEVSSFWLELSSLGKGVEARVFLRLPQEEPLEVQRIVRELQETPIQRGEEFAEKSPFRILGESRWWGPDLFREKYGEGPPVQRIEVGFSPELCELSEGQWLIWEGEKWKRVLELPAEKWAPIVRLEGAQEKNLILEGWEENRHVRLSLPLIQNPPFKARGEELFHSIRIRSEKQISCMLEKQCLILRIGDWVFKGEDRWKVLRKKEDREALKNGQLIGEIFVLDGMEVKQGQKVIQGTLFNAARSQMIPIELPAFSSKKIKEGKRE